MPVTLFKDITKRNSDLLTKEYPSEKQENKIEWKGETLNGVTFETNFVQKKDGSYVGTFIPKYKIKEHGATVSAEINTKKDFKGEIAVENKFADGLKTTLSWQTKGEDRFATVGVDYKQDSGNVSVTADYGKAAGSTAKASGVVGYQGFSLGASAEYFVGNSQESQLKEVHSVLTYGTPEFDLAVFGRIKAGEEEDTNEIGFNYYHGVNSDLTVGTEVSFDTANTEAKPKLVFGGQYIYDKETTLKSKFDTTGQLSFSYGQKLNKHTKLTLSTTLDTNNLGGKNSSSLGFILSFTD